MLDVDALPLLNLYLLYWKQYLLWSLMPIFNLLVYIFFKTYFRIGFFGHEKLSEVRRHGIYANPPACHVPASWHLLILLGEQGHNINDPSNKQFMQNIRLTTDLLDPAPELVSPEWLDPYKKQWYIIYSIHCWLHLNANENRCNLWNKKIILQIGRLSIDCTLTSS